MTVNYLFISGGADVEELPYPKFKEHYLKTLKERNNSNFNNLTFYSCGFFPISKLFLLGLITIHIAVGDFV